MQISVFIIPIFLILLLLHAKRKKVNAYVSFVEGAKSSIDLSKDIFPFLIAIFVAVNLFRESGLILCLSNFLSPVLKLFGIPHELCELIFIRPFSGSASLAILENIFSQFGPDSYVSRCASTIMGSSETVFYIATIYFSQTKAKRLLYAIPVALLCTFVGAVISCLVCKIMWITLQHPPKVV